jgi:hypothetical protein
VEVEGKSVPNPTIVNAFCAMRTAKSLMSSGTSGYFVRLRAAVGTPWKTMVYQRYPKLAIVCDVESHFILA